MPHTGFDAASHALKARLKQKKSSTASLPCKIGARVLGRGWLVTTPPVGAVVGGGTVVVGQAECDATWIDLSSQ